MKLEAQELDESVVTLDPYNSDLNLVIGASRNSASPLTNEGFAFMWAGARATHGFAKGKICFEVKILEYLDVSHLPADEPNPHVVRVGFSVESSTLQLGEDPLSYGYGGTGKISTNCQFKDFGGSFAAGDVILGLLNMDADQVQIGYAKNGKFLGWAYRINKNELKGQALFPHILTKNTSFEVNFGQKEKPYFPLPDAAKDFIFANCVPLEQRVNGTRAPAKIEDCEMIMMCGLPGAGKSFWAAEYSAKNPGKKYNVLGTNNIIDKMKVMGLPRKRNYAGRWDVLIQMATKCLNKMFEIGSKLRRNYILDQTNVYPSAQRRKMKNFQGFKRTAVVVVPSEEEYKKRCDKRDREEGKEVPDSAVNEMKANFKIPEESDIFDKIMFTELQRSEAEKLVRIYNEDGRAATGPPRKQFRPSDSGYGNRGFNSQSDSPGRGGFAGRGGYEGNSGGYDNNRGRYGGTMNRGGNSRGGFDGGRSASDNRGGYGGSRGGFDGGRGSYESGRGGYEGSRGGYEGSRGGYKGGRGGYEGGRGGYEGGRGGYEGGRGGYEGGRGGYEGGRGGYEGGRGGYESGRRGGNEGGRGGYDGGRGGYDGNRMNYEGGQRGFENNRSGYDSGQRGFDNSRSGGYEGNRSSYEEGQRSFEGSRGGYQGNRSGYDDMRGIKRSADDRRFDSPSGGGSPAGYGGESSSQGNYGRGSSNYGNGRGFNTFRGGRGRGDFGGSRSSGGYGDSPDQYSSGNFGKDAGYDKGSSYSSRGQRGFQGAQTRGAPRGGSSRGGAGNSRGFSRGGYNNNEYSRDSSSNYTGSYGEYESDYGNQSQSGYRTGSDSYSQRDTMSHTSIPQVGFKKEPGTEVNYNSGSTRLPAGTTRPSGRTTTRWSAEEPAQTYPQRTAPTQDNASYNRYGTQVKTEPQSNTRYDDYSAQSSNYSSYSQSNQAAGYSSTQGGYGYQQGSGDVASQQWPPQSTGAATTGPGATNQSQQWSQYYQQPSQPNQYYNQYYGQPATGAASNYGSSYSN